MKHIHIYTPVRLILTLVSLTGLLTLQCGYGQETYPEIPEKKQTVLGLYVTAQEAYEKWQADPDKVNILDVRTPEEYIFIGHAEMAWNIPLTFQTYEWDATKGHFSEKPNPDFLDLVKDLFATEDSLLITCRSGGRSAMAVNLLAENGFKHAYNIIDGMEGDKVNDPESLYKGKRMKNGWKNSGLHWTYTIDPNKMKLPKD
jgi:rhodanese-related sulfurtransferase